MTDAGYTFWPAEWVRAEAPAAGQDATPCPYQPQGVACHGTYGHPHPHLFEGPDIELIATRIRDEIAKKWRDHP